MCEPNKMEIITSRINRWDKESIRPGPVGSVGDVNLQVKLKKSSNDQPDRYQKAFSGPNEVWSGSNVSDGQKKGFTSGGRGAVTISAPLPARESFKTSVGWVIENVVPVDRSRVVQTVPLGRYDWEATQARLYKVRPTGEQFLPLPMGYTRTSLPRGSQYPLIREAASGQGAALPPAVVKITDPVFGDTGSIEVDVPTCSGGDMLKVWVPSMDDPRRKSPRSDSWFFNNYPYRKDTGAGWVWQYPDIGKVKVYNKKTMKYSVIETSPCGSVFRDPTVPMPTKKERRPKPQEPREEKKQKMR